MRGDDLVFDAEVVESQDILRRSALECVQIFHLEVVLVPLELQTGSVGH